MFFWFASVMVPCLSLLFGSKEFRLRFNPNPEQAYLRG